MNPDRSILNSTTIHRGSSVRPRNRRLLSSDDGNDSGNEVVGSSTASSRRDRPSPYSSRGESSIPSRYPSRSPSTAKPSSLGHTNYGWTGTNWGRTNATTGTGLWESWSSLQGIASTLLGNDAYPASKSGNGGTLGGFPWRPSLNPGIPARSPPPQWGPPACGGQTLLPGSKEERRAMMQAQKREVLLLAQENEVSSPSTLHKRRNSDLRSSEIASGEDQDNEALVYVHKVQADDTLAGIIIRYQCQPAVFRKVNRLWPNDKVQIRDRVFLPVEACAIRGSKVKTGGAASNGKTSSLSEIPYQNQESKPHSGSPLLSPNTSSDQDPSYRHEHYICAPGIPGNIEIGRIPRRTLGFFPPSRRKSQTRFDTPRSSLEVSSRPEFNSSSLSAAATLHQKRKNNRLQRSDSCSNSHFLDHLRGPGGVGTLRDAQPGGVANPGPAQDGLNKMFANHLPSLEPPRESFDSVRSISSTGLENVGGKLEGWARKVGIRLVGNGRDSFEILYGRRTCEGDLIELENNSSGGAGDSGDQPSLEEWRQQQSTIHPTGEEELSHHFSSTDPNAVVHSRRDGDDTGNPTTTTTSTSFPSPSPPSSPLLSMERRFPPRGRVVDAQTVVPMTTTTATTSGSTSTSMHRRR